MKRAKDASLVFCLFVVYCVLLSQGLKASTGSALFGALAAVPLTVHLYRRFWPFPAGKGAGDSSPRQLVQRDAAEAEPETEPGRIDGRVRDTD